jgi:hypothetical protein
MKRVGAVNLFITSCFKISIKREPSWPALLGLRLSGLLFAEPTRLAELKISRFPRVIAFCQAVLAKRLKNRTRTVLILTK